MEVVAAAADDDTDDDNGESEQGESFRMGQIGLQFMVLIVVVAAAPDSDATTNGGGGGGTVTAVDGNGSMVDTGAGSNDNFLVGATSSSLLPR